MDGLEIRRATAEDKDDILNIADVYDGADYLKDFFDDVFVNCVHTTPYVAVYNGEIVGFAAAFVVDDGLTVISRSARVKEQFSGQGIYKMLSRHLLRLSSADVNAFTTIDTNTAISSSSFKESNNYILNKPLVRYNIDVRALRPTEDIQPKSESLIPVSKDLLQHFFTSQKHKEYLFPGDRMLVNWVPFRLLPSNIPIIWMREDHSLRLSDVNIEDGSGKGLMSISTAFYGRNGLYVYHLDLFGADSSSLKHHIESHLKFVGDQATGEATIVVASDPELHASVLKSILEESGLTFESFCSICLFEKVLNRDAPVE